MNLCSPFASCGEGCDTLIAHGNVDPASHDIMGIYHIQPGLRSGFSWYLSADGTRAVESVSGMVWMGYPADGES